MTLKTYSKNLVSKILLVSLLVLLTFNCRVYAQDDCYSYREYQYTLNDGSITIVGYIGKDSKITIPNLIAGYPVNCIAAGAFKDTPVKEVNFPSSIMLIENNAFEEGVIFNGLSSDVKIITDDDIVVEDPDESKDDPGEEYYTNADSASEEGSNVLANNPHAYGNTVTNTENVVSKEDKEILDQYIAEQEEKANSKDDNKFPYKILILSFICIVTVLLIVLAIKKIITKK